VIADVRCIGVLDGVACASGMWQAFRRFLAPAWSAASVSVVCSRSKARLDVESSEVTIGVVGAGVGVSPPCESAPSTGEGLGVAHQLG